jgi:hypothetical protein
MVAFAFAQPTLRTFYFAVAKIVEGPATMSLSSQVAAAACALVTALAFAAAAHPAEDGAITPQAQQLVRELDTMGVETKWIAGEHVYWESGLPTGVPETSPGKHTHCSAFVASAAKKLGVYILRPPEHGQKLLANAQNEWLAEEGAGRGWRKLTDAREAQAAANRGLLVVASYHNHHDDKPGHVAIVRPGNKTPEQIAAEGPDVIQAGSVNATSISIKAGFAGHPAAWRDNEIAYYAHEVKL